MTMEKKTAAVIFGGQSSEHVVSCMSAANVIDRINTDKYNLILIGITQEGKWLKVDSVQAIRDESWRKGTVSAAILPDAEKKCALFMENGTMTDSDISEIKAATESLQNEFYKISEELYKQAQANGQGAPGADGANGDPNVVDGDYKEM